MSLDMIRPVYNLIIIARLGARRKFICLKVAGIGTVCFGKGTFAILAFADAIESIPITLSGNAGMDTIDTLAEIRSRQSSMNPRIGVDAKELKVAYMRKKKIIEPLVVKEQILKSATEAVSELLRIDDACGSA